MADYAIECYVTDNHGSLTTPQHERLTNLASLLIAFWPFGVPCLFFGLLYASRRAQSQWAGDLSRAIAFLHREYRKDRW